VLVITVVLQWPQVMSVCGGAEGVGVAEGVGMGEGVGVGEGIGVGEGVGVDFGGGLGCGGGFAFALDTQSVAARQAQMTAATLCRAPRPVFAVRLLPRIGIGIVAGIMRSRAINPSAAHKPLSCGSIDTPVICRRVAKARINRVVLDKRVDGVSTPIDSKDESTATPVPPV
jgi:hypothetical protein